MINEILEQFYKLGVQATEKQVLSAVRRAKIRRGLDRKEKIFCSDWSYTFEACAHVAKGGDL